VYQSLSISGLLTLELHALNNEGAEGNTMMTRMVNIIDQQGRKHTVNAVSGDMFNTSSWSICWEHPGPPACHCAPAAPCSMRTGSVPIKGS